MSTNDKAGPERAADTREHSGPHTPFVIGHGSDVHRFDEGQPCRLACLSWPGEAGLAGPVNAVIATRILASEAEWDNPTTAWALRTFESRRGLVARQLARSPYLAGEAFTAADISVTYALELAQRTGNAVMSEAERAYLARTTARPAYGRAMDSCAATKAWVAAMAG